MSQERVGVARNHHARTEATESPGTAGELAVADGLDQVGEATMAVGSVAGRGLKNNRAVEGQMLQISRNEIGDSRAGWNQLDVRLDDRAVVTGPPGVLGAFLGQLQRAALGRCERRSCRGGLVWSGPIRAPGNQQSECHSGEDSAM